MHHAKENFKTSKCPPSIAPLRYMGRAGKRIASCSAARRRGKRIPPTVGDQDGGRGRGGGRGIDRSGMVAGAGVGTGGERALVDLLAQSISSGSSRAKLVAAFVGSAGANLCFLLLPLQIPLVVSALDDPHSSSNKDLLRGCARMVGLYLFRVVLGHGGRHLLNEVGEEALLGIQQRLFSAAQRLKVESFELEFGLGKILPLLEHDAPAIRDVLTINLERVVMGSFYVCGGIYLCLAISKFLTLVVFAAVVPIAASSMLLKRVSERFGRRLSDRRSRLEERSRLVLGSTRLVRSHACEELELARYKELGREYAAEASAQSVFMSACKGGSGLTHSFALMAIIFFGVRKASASDGLRSGELVALVNIVVEIGKHLDMAVNNYLLLSTAAGKGEHASCGLCSNWSLSLTRLPLNLLLSPQVPRGAPSGQGGGLLGRIRRARPDLFTRTCFHLLGARSRAQAMHLRVRRRRGKDQGREGNFLLVRARRAVVPRWALRVREEHRPRPRVQVQALPGRPGSDPREGPRRCAGRSVQVLGQLGGTEQRHRPGDGEGGECSLSCCSCSRCEDESPSC